jgi:manganese transport protein
VVASTRSAWRRKRAGQDGIPFALVPLVVLTSKASIMGGHVNRRHTVICAIACIAVIIALNVLILFQQFTA